ncbi:MAG: phosphonate metabolism transcriptional regulator PhnF [Desulfobulbaceae bacterium]|nr:MAG: phosphonate metabolism transcriptional regulator PhnF [Desulfobulbaceae bacterium]
MPKSIDSSNGSQPIYRQVSIILAHEIRKAYTPGDLLPSETKLARRFNINRHTLRRAVDELINSGVVNRVRGKGTFVITPVIDYDIKKTTRFTENLESQGRRAHSQVIRKIALSAPKGVAKMLGLKEKEPVALIETLRQADNSPFCLVSHFLPYNKFFQVLKKYETGSLHRFIRKEYHLHLQRTLSLITAVLPKQNDAELLRTGINSPLLRVKSLNVDTVTGMPVEYAIARFRGDAAQLSVEP